MYATLLWTSNIAFPVNLYTTSGLSILLHGVSTLDDATSYDKLNFKIFYSFDFFLDVLLVK